MTYRSDQTGFNWCTRPIINIEMGHLSNPDDDKLLSDEAFQNAGRLADTSFFINP